MPPEVSPSCFLVAVLLTGGVVGVAGQFRGWQFAAYAVYPHITPFASVSLVSPFKWSNVTLNPRSPNDYFLYLFIIYILFQSFSLAVNYDILRIMCSFLFSFRGITLRGSVFLSVT